jgi:thioredoxin reductase
VVAAVDLTSIAGKAPRAERRVPLVVVGAGPAGLAAALEAARAGIGVTLVDEHPLDFDLMAMDVPLHFGQRMSPSLRNHAAALERVVASNPGLAEVVEAGVDVQLGVMAWGAFRNGPTVRELDGPLLGLADRERSWLLGYERLVVAAGARDFGMAFPGWALAGVMGAGAAQCLLTRYGGLAARRMVVLGSGSLGLQTASLALERGIEVPAVVEVAGTVQGDDALRRRLEADGVRVYVSHTVREARGATGEVESVVLGPADGDLAPAAGRDTEIACDTVCLALGLIPNVELPSLLGCRLAFRAELGGFVPETGEDGQTSVPEVFAVGDCAGVAQGLAEGDGPTYWRRWLRSLLGTGGWDVHVCQCEEVTRRELVGVQPPRYLKWQSDRMSARNLDTLLGDGPLSQDQVKRLTRVGMGPCQGRRCREQVALLLAEEAGIPVSAIPLPSYRPPVRPLPLSVLWPHDEPPEMREHWVGWFGIPTQFGPQWKTAPADEP